MIGEYGECLFLALGLGRFNCLDLFGLRRRLAFIFGCLFICILREGLLDCRRCHLGFLVLEK